MKGIYILILRMKESKDIRVGKLGRLHFRRGYYSYVGSAQGSGGEKRITRHFNVAYGKNTTRKWHIDYLMPHSEVLCAVFLPTSEALECTVAESLEFEGIPGFGCSDCTCRSHLFFSREDFSNDIITTLNSLTENESIIIHPHK
jgi:Uri superfamily endonuclease